MGLTRREFVVGAALACGARTAAVSNSERASVLLPVETSKSLGERAAAKGILFGTALGTVALKDAAYALLVAQQCTIGVPESELKWKTLRPTPDQFNFGGGDYCYEFLNAHGMKYR